MKIKIILKYVLSFLLSIFLVMLTFLVMLQTTIFNQDYILKTLDKNNYYDKVSTEMREEMENYMISSGFPEDILNNLYEVKEVKEDINNYVNGFYHGEKGIIATDKIKEKLKKNIDDYLNKNHVQVINEENIDDFIDDIADIYCNEVSLYKLIDSFPATFYKLLNLINHSIYILIFVIILIIVLLIKLKKAYFASSLMGCGLILLFIRLVIYEKIDIENILIITEEFSDIIKIIFNVLENKLLLVSIIYIVIGVVISMLTLLCQSRKNINKKLLK